MKDKIINMLMDRPEWFNHEGYYRILVVVRFLLFVPIVLWAGACILLWSPPGKFAEGLAYCAMGIALAFGVILVLNLLLRAVGWVVVGFKDEKKM